MNRKEFILFYVMRKVLEAEIWMNAMLKRFDQAPSVRNSISDNSCIHIIKQYIEDYSVINTSSHPTNEPPPKLLNIIIQDNFV